MTEKLSRLQKEVLTGTLLGDAHLQINKSRTKASLVILQGDLHKEYVFYLYDIFKTLNPSVPRPYLFTDKRFPGKSYKRWSFRTKLLKSLMPYANLFYPQKFFITDFGVSLNLGEPLNKNSTKKCVPSSIEKMLTPRGIAFWYMDDGSAKWQNKSRAMRFCTDSFSEQDVLRLISVLKNKFNIISKLYKEMPKPKVDRPLPKIKHRIYIGEAEYPLFTSLVFKYLHPSMISKYPKAKAQDL